MLFWKIRKKINIISSEIKHTEEEKVPEKKPGFFRRWGKRLRNFLLGLFLLVLILFLGTYYAIQQPEVQNWLIEKSTDYLSGPDALNTTVEVDSIRLEFFNKLVLEGVYVEDQQQDTLFYIGQLKTDLTSSLWSLVWDSQLDMSTCHLEDAVINLRRNAYAEKSNIQFIVDYFSSPPDSTKSEKRNFIFDLDELYLKNIRFHNLDSVIGQDLKVWLPYGSIETEDIDLKNNHIKLSIVDIQKPDVRLIEFKRHPLTVPADSTIEITASPPADSNAFQVSVLDLNLETGFFKYDSYRRRGPDPSRRIDFQHFEVNTIDIAATQVHYQDWKAKGLVRHLSFKEKNGFELDKITANALVTPRKVQLTDLLLLTEESSLGDTLIFKYKAYNSFWDFPNEVYMRLLFNDSEVVMDDVMAFVPALERNEFFRKNRNEKLRLNGEVRGKVNSLKGKNLEIELANSTKLNGSFSSRNLNIRDEEIINLKLDNLETTIADLKLLIPNLKLPPNFNKLGKLQFKGRFDGFIKDFVAFGDLKTDLGRARTDLRMDIKDGGEKAKYSGKINLEKFNLERWLDDEQFGTISLNGSVEGTGLRGSTVDAKIDATVDHFDFKEYAYRDISLSGKFNQRRFNIDLLKVNDPNVKLDLTGNIFLGDSIPEFDLKTNISTLNLYPLNFAKDNLEVQGDLVMDFKGDNLDNFVGEASALGIKIQRDTNLYEIDTLNVLFEDLKYGNRHLSVRSNIINADLEGVFDLPQIGESLTQYIEKNFPAFAQRANIAVKKFETDTLFAEDGSGNFEVVSRPRKLKKQQFNFNIHIRDSKNFSELLDKNLGPVKDAYLIGFYDNFYNNLKLEAKIPNLKYANVEFGNTDIAGELKSSDGNFEINMEELLVNDSIKIPPILVSTALSSDTILFNLNASYLEDVVDDLNLNGQLTLYGDMFQVTLLPSDLSFYNEKWTIAGDNYIRFGRKEYIETKNLILTNKNQVLSINSKGEKGLELNLNAFSLELLKPFIDSKRLKFDGVASVEADIDNVFKMKDLSALISMDTVWINGENWGKLTVNAKAPEIKNTITADVSLSKPLPDGEEQLLTVKGLFLPAFATTREQNKNSFDAEVRIENFPVSIAEYFILKGISQTEGRFDAALGFSGNVKKPSVAGEVVLRESTTRIDYLGLTLTASKIKATIDDYLIDLSGNRIYDIYGNSAVITKGITHDHLRNFGLDAIISSPKFLFLNTKKEDNEIYYGQALGEGRVEFSGDFKNTDIYVNAIVNDESVLNIPISYTQKTREINFITFVNNKKDSVDVEAKNPVEEIRGVNLDMEIEVTNSGKVRLIFDEAVGDIMEGRGTGDLVLAIRRTGEFTLRGGYTLEEGNYLFTYQNLSVVNINKPFAVRPGGTIRWSGDPFNAQIDIEAIYEDLSTAPYNLILEYLTTGDENKLASKSTGVDLSMYLTGELMKPDINFDIELPEVDLAIRSYVDGKLRTIRNDKNELNRQVFGLMVTGSFLPQSNSSGVEGNQSVTGINTLSEVISNQLSNYLTDLIGEVVEEGRVFGGLSLDLGYRLYQVENTTDAALNDPTTGSELQFGVKNYLFNKRLIVNIGGNIDLGTSETVAGVSSGAYFAGDLVVEYLLTPDGRYRIRAFSRTDTDGLGDRRNKTGLGISYQRQFDTFQEFVDGMKDSFRKVIKGKRRLK